MEAICIHKTRIQGGGQAGKNAATDKHKRVRGDVNGVDNKANDQGNCQQSSFTATVHDQGKMRKHKKQAKARAKPDPTGSGAQHTGKPARLKEREVHKFCPQKGRFHVLQAFSDSPMRESRS